MDFTYIYDTTDADHLGFMVGETATLEEVQAEIGNIGEQSTISFDRQDVVSIRPAATSDRVEAAMAKLKSRALSEAEIDDLMR